MHYYPTPIGDLLDAVVGPQVMPTWNRSRQPGGEWDYIRSLPIKTRRRLTAAGYMAKRAMGPDSFADLIRRNAPGTANMSDGECHEWYVRHARLALIERRRATNYNRKLRLARRHGAPTYYALRDAQARLAGYRSYFDQRNEEAKAAGYRSYHHQRMSS